MVGSPSFIYSVFKDQKPCLCFGFKSSYTVKDRKIFNEIMKIGLESCQECMCIKSVLLKLSKISNKNVLEIEKKKTYISGKKIIFLFLSMIFFYNQ